MAHIAERVFKNVISIPEDGPPSEIRKFYAGKSIFMTGATGFMGQAYVEKILRDCPELKRLYVLIRGRKGVSPQERMNKFFQHIVFDRLRNTNPNFQEKVVTINGDQEVENLGISTEDRKILIEAVDIIVHNGAVTKFDEKANVALKINVLSTKYILDLAMECKHIEAFMYVSTAYSHCYQRNIEEKFYPPPGDVKMVHDIIESDQNGKNGISEDALQMLLGKWPNVYVFTKSIAEDLVRQYGERADFSIGVYRPTIVSAASREPLPGYISLKSGPASVAMGAMLGLVHAAYCPPVNIDMIPLDYSINSLIAATFDLPNRWKTHKKPLVYNFGSSTLNPTSYDVLYNYVIDLIPKIGSKYVMWYTFVIFVSEKFMFIVLHILLHFFPAILADAICLALGKERRALSLFMTSWRNLDKIFYFTDGDWRIHCPEMMKVLDGLNETDRLMFDFNIRMLDWRMFIEACLMGGRLYIMKEPLDTIEHTKKRYQRLKILHYVTSTVLFVLILYYFNKLLNFIFGIFI